MEVRLRYRFSYEEDKTGTIDITVPAEDLPEDEDWLYLLQEHADAKILELAYGIEFIGLEYF